MSPLLRLDGWRERGKFRAQGRAYEGMIKRALRDVRRTYRHLKPPLVDHKFFGAPQVDPKYLTICLFFRDDNALNEAHQKSYPHLLHGAVIAALREECYPQASLDGVKIQFLSKKAINNAGGFWTFWR